MFTVIETALAGLGDPHDESEWSQLFSIWSNIGATLDRSEHRAAGQKHAAKSAG